MKYVKKLFATFLAAMFVCLLITISTAQAATFSVNTSTPDKGDAAPGDGSCSMVLNGVNCTLRAAIEEANALPGDDVIQFVGGMVQPNPPVTIQLTLGELYIYTNVTINGPGARQILVDSNETSRIFRIGAGQVKIIGITIQDGKTAAIPQQSCSGAGILNNGGVVTLTGVAVRDNIASGDCDGGGIFNWGTLTILNSTVSGNSASSGGGINSNGGVSTLNLINSTVTGNIAYSIGGGIIQYGTGTIVNSTVSNNLGLAGYGGIITGGSLSLRNTIVANNIAAPDIVNFGGTLVSLGNNLVKDRGTTTGYVASDLPNGTDPNLGPLQYSDTPTGVRPLLTGSPAINAGNNCVVESPGCLATPLTTDQTMYYARKFGVAVDIGASEAQFGPTAATVTAGGRIRTVSGKGIVNVRVTVTLPSGETRTTVSGAGGYYQFADIPAGETYIFSASAKHYVFTQPTQIRNITEDTEDINFVANANRFTSVE
jgi:hypothetical protein